MTPGAIGPLLIERLVKLGTFACLSVGIVLVLLVGTHPLAAQTPPTTVPTTQPLQAGILQQYRGKPVEGVPYPGNRQVSSSVIANVIRTREGQKFDPATVEEDYQRIFTSRNSPTSRPRSSPPRPASSSSSSSPNKSQIRSISFRGNVGVDTPELEAAVDIKPGEGIDPFRIALAKQAIGTHLPREELPLRHVDVPPDELATRAN